MIFTGAKAPNPSALVSGPLFQEMMQFVKSVYDYVIVDTPPLNLVIDGLLIAKQCDGAVLVVESGLTERAQAEKARRQMEYAGINILGAVVNKVKLTERRYGYGYGYGYGEEDKSDQKGKNSVNRKKKNGKSKK